MPQGAMIGVSVKAIRRQPSLSMFQTEGTTDQIGNRSDGIPERPGHQAVRTGKGD